MSDSSLNKVVVIGLDGVDWRLLQPWIDAGELPTLARLVQEGAHGRLKSTVRPESSVAWTTFSTGVNPGKHGIFGFVRHQPSSYEFHLADSRHIGARRFWDYLGAAGLRVGLVNVPFTYPPQPVNGFLVGGMLTPGSHVTFTYPAALQQRLMQHLPAPYLFDAGDSAKDKAKLWQSVSAYTRQQLETAVLLLREEVWNFFAIVFTGPDRLQHFFWPSDVKKSEGPTNGELLLTYFKDLDQSVAKILGELPTDALVLFLSDHGFNAVGRRFYINSWLQSKGYLSLRSRALSTDYLSRLLTRLKSISLVRRLKQTFLPTEWGVGQLKTAVFANPIDWTKTRVYYAPDGGLRINLQGREPNGIVPFEAYESLCATLSSELSAVKDMETGCSPIAGVYQKKNLYHGPFTSSAPDLIVEPQRERDPLEQNYLIDSKLGSDLPHFTSSTPYNGNHAPHGILLAWGNGVAAHTTLPESDLQDIAPTILAAMGVPIPKTMDGRVLFELFTDQKCPDPTFLSETEPSSLGEAMYSLDAVDEPETAVIERLRNLGYLD